MNLILNDNFFNDILSLLPQKNINKNEFLNWVSTLNKNLIDTKKNNWIQKYFYKDKIRGISPVAVDDKNLCDVIFANHNKYLNPFVETLEKRGVYFWQEYINVLLSNVGIIKTKNLSLLYSYLMNNEDFLIKNKNKIISLVNVVSDEVKKNNINYFSDVFQFVLYLITYKGVFDNDWLIEKIDVFFMSSGSNPTKQFKYTFEKYGDVITSLDFNDKRVSYDFKKALKGNLAINKLVDNNVSLYFEINVQKFYQSEKLVEQIVLNNLTIGLNSLVDGFKKHLDVLHISLEKKDKLVLAFSLIAENKQIVEKIDILLESILEESRKSNVIIKDDFDKKILFMVLNDKLTHSEKEEKKRTKI